jgi:hypothetical protein
VLVLPDLLAVVCVVFITVNVFTGEGAEFLSFAVSYPFVVWRLAVLALCGAVGQVSLLSAVTSVVSLLGGCFLCQEEKRVKFSILFSDQWTSGIQITVSIRK